MTKYAPYVKWNQPVDPGDIRAAAASIGGGSGTSENADTVDGYHASLEPTALYLLPLDENAELPNSVIPGYDAQYVVMAASSNLDNERVLTAGTGISITDGGAGLAVTITPSFSATAPGTITPDATAAAGSSSYPVRLDHTHGITCAAPGANSVYLSDSSEGSATSFARSDHKHNLYEGIAPTWTGKHTWQLATEQVRIGYDASNYASFTVDSTGKLLLTTTTNSSSGNLELQPVGDLIVDPGGNDLLPDTAYDINIGALQKKFLTLHVAELWVESLVAQDTIATIGGRILVAPTTTLTRDMAPSDTTIYVTHNQMTSGDIGYLEAQGKVEFIVITSSAAASAELLSNGGFETAGTGGTDVWGSWTESAGTGSLANETSVKRTGSDAAKMTAGSSANTSIYQAVSVTAGRRYKLSFWYADNNYSAARYKVYDSASGTDIIPIKALNVTGTTYEYHEAYFVAPTGATFVRIYLYCPADNTRIAYFDDVSLAAAEYSYTCTRNEDGTGANQWHAGDAIVNTGQADNGWLDLYSFWSMQARPCSYIFNYDNSAGTYSDNYAQEKRWTLFPSNPALNDCIYFGGEAATWDSLFFYIGTAGVYTATLTWEYYKTSWTAFTPTVNDGFATTGTKRVTWGTLASWATVSVNNVTGYWVRCRLSAFTSMGTKPVQNGRRVAIEKGQVGPTIVGNIRASTTWNDWNEGWAIGNLAGLYGYSSDTYGAAFGKYANDQTWLAVDATNGFRIMKRASDTDTQIAQWATDGTITVGQTSSGQGNVQITAAKLVMRTDTTEKIRLETDGDVFIGTNISGTIDGYFQNRALCIFTNAQTYNDESVGAGDVLLGTNISGKGNMLWDYSEGQLLFRGGTTTQVYIDTDGTLMAGGGYVALNSGGMQLIGITDRIPGSTIEFNWNGLDNSTLGAIWAQNTLDSYPTVYIAANPYNEFSNGSIIITASYDINNAASLAVGASSSGGNVVRMSGYNFTGLDLYGSLLIDRSSTLTTATIDIRADAITHGMTSVAASTNTFADLRHIESTGGGLLLRGFHDSDGAYSIGASIQGFSKRTADTTKGSSSVGLVDLYGGQIYGTSYGNVTGNGNILTVRCRRDVADKTLLIVDEDGDLHVDGSTSLTPFDDHNDALAVADLYRGLRGDWERTLAYNRNALVRMGVLSDGGMLSYKNLMALMMGAIGQLYERTGG